MLIIAGWALIAVGFITTLLVIITAYKSGLPNEIKELKMIKSSGFASEHSTEVKRGNIYREKGIPEANIPRRERTVSASARELLKEVEAEREAERIEGAAAARNRAAKPAQFQNRNYEREAARKTSQSRPSPNDTSSTGVLKDTAGTDVLPVKRNVSNVSQGTDVLRMGDAGVQVSAGTDILFVNGSYNEENLPQEAEPIQKKTKPDAQYRTDILTLEAGTDVLNSSGTDILPSETGTDVLSNNKGTDVLISDSATDVLNSESGTDILTNQKDAEGTDILSSGAPTNTPSFDVGTDLLESEQGQTCSKPRERGTDILRESGTEVLCEEAICAKTQCKTDILSSDGSDILKESGTDILR